MKNIKYCVSDDWEILYVDNKLYYQNHDINVFIILNEIHNKVNNHEKFIFNSYLLPSYYLDNSDVPCFWNEKFESELSLNYSLEF